MTVQAESKHRRYISSYVYHAVRRYDMYICMISYCMQLKTGNPKYDQSESRIGADDSQHATTSPE